MDVQHMADIVDVVDVVDILDIIWMISWIWRIRKCGECVCNAAILNAVFASFAFLVTLIRWQRYKQMDVD